MWRNVKKLFAKQPEIIWYSLLSLIIMGPILKGGFVLTFDMVFTPIQNAPTEVSNTYILQWLVHIFSLVLGGAITEKLLIFLILTLSGIGMHRLVVSTQKVKDVRTNGSESKNQILYPKSYILTAYLGGIFYTINPFTYERWMAGQYLILMGYALLPFLVKSLMTLFIQPTRHKAVPVTLWFTAIAMSSIHTFAIAIFLSLIMFAVYMLGQSPKGKYYQHMWKYAGITILGVVALNSYWLIGVLSGRSSIRYTVDSIGQADINAFTTATGTHGGLLFNVASMYGFWLERFGRYAMPNHNLFIWFGGFALILGLVALGIKQQRSQKSLLAVSLGIAGLVGLFIALGTKVPVAGATTNWIINNLPLMKGFREPEKFSMLLVLAYAFFAAHGLNYLLQKLRNKPALWREALGYGALALPLLYVSTMLFGFAGQLKPVHYPASWYSFNKSLKQNPPTGKILFLPWHQYMSYDFTSRIIANPAPNFFDATVIAGTNAQYGGIDDPTPTATSKYIQTQVLDNIGQNNLGSKLAGLNVQYVLLANGYDFYNYGWLSYQSDLKEISSQPGLTVYKNLAYHE